MIEYSICGYDEKEETDLEKKIDIAITQEEKKDCIKQFRKEFKEDVVTKFLEEVD